MLRNESCSGENFNSFYQYAHLCFKYLTAGAEGCSRRSRKVAYATFSESYFPLVYVFQILQGLNHILSLQSLFQDHHGIYSKSKAIFSSHQITP